MRSRNTALRYGPGLMLWAATGLAQMPAPIAAPPTLASVPVMGVTLRGATGLANGRASLANHAGVTTGGKSASVSLQRGGSMLVCPGSTLRIAKDTTARTEGAPGDAGLAFSLDGGGFEAKYKLGVYPDVIMTRDLQFLVSGPGQADLKLRVDAKGNTCVDNAGENAPYITAGSRTGGKTYRLRPGQHVLFQHGSLEDIVNNAPQPCGCQSSGLYGPESHALDTPGIAASIPAAQPATSKLKSRMKEPYPEHSLGNLPGDISGQTRSLSPTSPSSASLVTRTVLTVLRLFHHDTKKQFSLSSHQPSLRLHHMDSYLETDVLIMIFAVALTITLSLAIQAAVFIALFILVKRTAQKLLWAAEDIKDAAAPATEQAQGAIHECMQLVRKLGEQPSNLNLVPTKPFEAETQPVRKTTRSLPAGEIAGEQRPIRRTTRPAASSVKKAAVVVEQGATTREVVDVPSRDALRPSEEVAPSRT